MTHLSTIIHVHLLHLQLKSAPSSVFWRRWWWWLHCVVHLHITFACIAISCIMIWLATIMTCKRCSRCRSTILLLILHVVCFTFCIIAAIVHWLFAFAVGIAWLCICIAEFHWNCVVTWWFGLVFVVSTIFSKILRLLYAFSQQYGVTKCLYFSI